MVGCHVHRVHITIGGILMLGLMGVVHHSWHLATAIKKIRVILDPNFSPLFASLIHEKLYKLLEYEETQYTIVSTLHNHFRCIATIDSHRYAPGCITYTITALLPRYNINNNLVLCDNHELISNRWYNQSLCERLPTITTEKPLTIGIAPQGLRMITQKLPSSLAHYYDIVWNSDIETILTHKKNADFTITCNATCTSDRTIYTQCEAIYTSLVNRNLSSKTKTINADIRFTNQIVIHVDQGRTING